VVSFMIRVSLHVLLKPGSDQHLLWVLQGSIVIMQVPRRTRVV